MTYTWEQAKHDAEVAAQMEQQLRGSGWQYVEHQAHRGVGLIELKANTPHGEYSSHVRNLGLNPKNIDRLTILARYLPLLEQNKPNSQRDAFALIKKQQPPKQVKISPPKPGEETEVAQEKKRRFSYLRVLTEEGLLTGSETSAAQNMLRASIEAIDKDAITSKDEMRVRTACRVIVQDRFDKTTDPSELYEKHREECKTLPATAKEKFDRLVARELKLRNDLIDIEVRKAADAMIPERIALYNEMTKKASEQVRNYAMRKNGIHQSLTTDDYRFLLNVLHPDRPPENTTREKLEKAFNIVMKLEPYIKAFAT